MFSRARRAALLAPFLATAALAADPLAGVTAIAVGYNHSCAIVADGAVKCWGRNDLGQLGDGSTTDREYPANVTGLPGAVVAIDAGYQHTCAVTAGGAAWCWGYNEMGQLGDGSTEDRALPVAVSGLSTGVAAISAGYQHTCARTTAGAAHCWGRGGMGQLGNGGTASSETPVAVTGLDAGVSAIVARGHHSCAVVSGALKCWGWNYYHQLGDDTTTNRPLPNPVPGLASGVAGVAAGEHHSCAFTTGGAASCWGENTYGQLGDSTATPRAHPVAVTGLGSSVSAMAGGRYHTCAIVAGAAMCWGQGGGGQVGDGGTSNRTAPTAVLGLGSGVTAIAGGENHSCALITGGGMKCWGLNTSGQIGDGWRMHRLAPVTVAGLPETVTAFALGLEHSCALTGGGAVKCWGNGALGQLGTGTSAKQPVAVQVTGLGAGVTAITAGHYHTCALVSGGVKCWGHNGAGQLGDNSTSTRYEPVDVSGLATGVVSIGAYYVHSCAVTSTGLVKCWGYNEHGQLGDSSQVSSPVPVTTAVIAAGATKVAAGTGHSCAFVSGATLCWGWNVVGQLGDGSTIDRNTPGTVPSLPTLNTALSAGDFHSCVVTPAGGLKCWGDNSAGQLGDDTTAMRTQPVDTAVLGSGVTAVAGGASHTCAVASAGAWCWGWNAYGQLGDGTGTSRTVPAAVAGLGSGVSAIGAGYGHACAALAAGGARCWGLNEYSQAGDGTTSIRPVPGDVLAADATPDAFGFATQSGVPPGSERTSEAIAPAGFDATVAVLVSGGSYSIGCTDAFTTAPGSLAAGQTICVRHTAAATAATAAVTTLTIGGVAGTFTSITALSLSPSSVVLTGPVAAAFGQPVTFTANVTGLAPTGTVAFLDGATAIPGCSAVPLAAGLAECHTATLARGIHPVSAAYPGDAANQASVSNHVILAVRAAARGDAGADGKSDLFWRTAAPGTGLSWWMMNGASATAANYHDVDPAWQIADVGDLDGDGKADLVWRRASDGATYLWLLDGFAFKGFADLGVLDPAAWSLAGTGDLNGDGKDDVVWRGADGTVYAWLMNGG
ncbi:MAG: Ig-like domain repeat protein, partial [Burkholderiales bacterium]|nr:Ig-like domain repeat protein [Burkholderiales bacterium]